MQEKGYMHIHIHIYIYISHDEANEKTQQEKNCERASLFSNATSLFF